MQRTAPLFRDRADAGRRLASALAPLPRGTIVLGVPRGGVVVAREVSDGSRVPLGVLLAHKLGAPGNPELAIGGVGPDGRAVLDRAVIDSVGGVDEAYVERETARQAAEIARRTALYGSAEVGGRDVVVVDDGIATGSTLRVAATWARAAGARSVTIAAPVGSPSAVRALAPLCDRIVVLVQPPSFVAVGQWYRRFEQVDDEDVVACLAGARRS